MTIMPLLTLTARRGLRSAGGFTLVELVIAVVLMGILAAVGASLIFEGFTTAGIVDSKQAGANQSRYALERLEREIREVKYAGTSYSIDTMLPTKMVFTRSPEGGSDITVTICNGADPACNGGSTLTLGYSTIPGTTSTLSDRVDAGGFTLSYCLVDGTTCDNTVTNSNVRFVQITLTVNDPIRGQRISQSTRVALRNSG